MHSSIRVIHIAWREKAGNPRHIVAKLKRTAEGIYFSKNKANMDIAKKQGLDYLAGFHKLEDGISKDIEYLLLHRLINKDRPDKNTFLDFWEASNTTNTFDRLGLTQGKSPTDNIEFLAEFYPKKGIKFVTDLAGLSHLKIETGKVSIGDILSFKREKNNEYDKNAVAIYKGDSIVGYVKQIHNRFFQKLKHPVKLQVKAIDQNGYIKQIFILVTI